MYLDEGSARALHDFFALSPSDRRAVARHLSPLEQRLLCRVARHKPAAGRGETVTAYKVRLSAHSPQMKKLLRRLIETHGRPSERAITAATRQALLELLANERSSGKHVAK